MEAAGFEFFHVIQCHRHVTHFLVAFTMGIHIKKLKVRPRKSQHVLFPSFHKSQSCSDAANNMCAPQLAAMLGCWAATADLHSVNACSDAAQTLFQCMRTTVCSWIHPANINHCLILLFLWSLCQKKCIDLLLITILLDWGKTSNKQLPGSL